MLSHGLSFGSPHDSRNPRSPPPPQASAALELFRRIDAGDHGCRTLKPGAAQRSRAMNAGAGACERATCPLSLDHDLARYPRRKCWSWKPQANQTGLR
eukprot:2779866-Rhodomonas_salina.12